MIGHNVTQSIITSTILEPLEYFSGILKIVDQVHMKNQFFIVWIYKLNQFQTKLSQSNLKTIHSEVSQLENIYVKYS